ncbi:hypothetical protein BpHYR1_046043 [Brachionus plicatilis]|uniref:Uncharacterized protein n=1 Tax=Brachionus plicatilis TaxID=10195 RepID=A0A3M7P5D4_BRAPC|nr:hypothetical protein BpHYR1_046043 [Brachionus plicatilis]
MKILFYFKKGATKNVALSCKKNEEFLFNLYLKFTTPMVIIKTILNNILDIKMAKTDKKFNS